jgi:hypothetical protein
LRLELHRAGLQASLQTTTSTAAAAKKAAERSGAAEEGPDSSLVDLAPTSLHAWERKLGPYLAELLARMIGANDVFSALKWSGYEVILADGTVVTRPGSEGVTARVLYAMRLASMSMVACEVTDGHGCESLRHFQVREGQLWICDRYYANPEDVAWVKAAGGDVLVRLNRGALPLYDAQRLPFDPLAHARSITRPDEMAEWEVWVHPKGRAPIRGRLCVVRLSEDDTEKARQWLHRDHGNHVSRASLEAAQWLLIFTTVPSERMTTAQVLALYRLRWQVELEIKRDKSLGGLDRLPNFLPETIATWLLAKLLIHQIARKIVSPAVAFPPSAVGIAAAWTATPRTIAVPHEAGGH